MAKAESCSDVTSWRMIQDHTQYSLNKDHQHHGWQPQKSWTLFQDYRDAQDKQQPHYPLVPRWKMEDAPTLLKIPKSECPDIWIRLPKHKWPKSWSCMEDTVVPLERNLYGHPLAGLSWERQFEKVLLKHVSGQVPNLECFFGNREKKPFLSVLCMVDDIKTGWEKTERWPNVEKFHERRWFGRNQHHSSTMFFWVAIKDKCEISKNIVDNYRNMFESRIFLVLWKNYQKREPQGSVTPTLSHHAPMTWKVMQRNVWKDIASWRTKQPNNYTKSRRRALMTTNLKKQFYGSWSDFSRCRFTHGWDSRSRSLGF